MRTTTGGAWLSAAQVGARLGLPVRTVLELARHGGLPADRQPVGALRFSWPAVVDALAAEPLDAGR